MAIIELLSDDQRVDVLNYVARYADEVSVNAEEAGLFLAKSPKSLERWRLHGVGPDYRQDPPMPGKDGALTGRRNQAVSYLMGDLRAWRQSMTVRSTGEAMQRNKRMGLAFAGLDDLLDEQPWFKKAGKVDVLGHALATTPDGFAAMLADPNAELVWLTMPDAMSRPWNDLEARTPFHKAYIDVLSEAMHKSELRLEGAVLNASAEAAMLENKKPGDASPESPKGRRSF